MCMHLCVCVYVYVCVCVYVYVCVSVLMHVVQKHGVEKQTKQVKIIK